MQKTSGPKGGLPKPDDATVHAAKIARRGAISAAAITAGCGLVAAVVTGFITYSNGKQAAPTTTVTVTVKETVTASGGAAPQASSAKQVATREVRLIERQGVDVDAATLSAADTDGPNAAIDLYLGSLLQVNGGQLYEDTGPEKGAQERCARAVAQGANANTIGANLYEGKQYCFRTSNGRTAWMLFNQAGHYDNPRFIVLKVLTFD